ncbi:MAG: glutathione S-transferase, partial [Thioalkalispiraceae bacterium]
MSDLILILGNKNYSSWSLRPWVFMKQMGISFQEKRVALFTETTNAELAEYDSDFKVPVLKDDELLVWDSLAILEYLSEKHLAGKGLPQDEKARATARSVCAEMHSSFVNVRNEMPMNCRRTFHGVKFSAEALREVERIKYLWRK